MIAFAISATSVGREPSTADTGTDLMATPGSMPDIYHLVFDRYGSVSALQAERGIYNGEFVDWLEDQGFHVAKDARANYIRTPLSLASTLSLSLLDDLPADVGAGSADLGPTYQRIPRQRGRIAPAGHRLSLYAHRLLVRMDS